jgi:hypothetical protein
MPCIAASPMAALHAAIPAWHPSCLGNRVEAVPPPAPPVKNAQEGDRSGIGEKKQVVVLAAPVSVEGASKPSAGGCARCTGLRAVIAHTARGPAGRGMVQGFGGSRENPPKPGFSVYPPFPPFCPFASMGWHPGDHGGCPAPAVQRVNIQCMRIGHSTLSLPIPNGYPDS